MARRKPEFMFDYRGHTLFVYRDKCGRVVFWGNRPFNHLADAKAAVDEFEDDVKNRKSAPKED